MPAVLIAQGALLISFLPLTRFIPWTISPHVHASVELFVAGAGFYIFAVGLARYTVLHQRISLLLGLSFLVVSLMDIPHALAYPGLVPWFGSNNYGVATGMTGGLTLGVLTLISSGRRAGSPLLKGLPFSTYFAVGMAVFLGLMIDATLYVLPLRVVDEKGVPTDLTGFLTLVAAGLIVAASIRFVRHYYRYQSPLYSWTASGLLTYAFYLIYVVSTPVFAPAWSLGHVLKLISYGLILYGVVFEYIRAYRAQERAFEDEVERAAAVQARLLPRQGFEHTRAVLYAKQVQAKVVGGDWYDHFETDGRLVVAIGDASGKGMFAALLATMVLTNVRSGYSIESTLASLLHRVNAEVVKRVEDEHFATMFVAELDLKGEELRYVNCGQDPPLLYRSATRSWDYLATDPTIPLGIDVKDFMPQLEVVSMAPGDRLILYTDGLRDVRNIEGKFLTSDQVLEFLRAEPASLVSTLVEAVIAYAIDFGAGNIPDDITVVGLDAK